MIASGGSERLPPSGADEDPTLPDIHYDVTAPVALDERPVADEAAEAKSLPFAVRADAWRRHYLPLPDEVIQEYLGDDEYIVHYDHPSFRAFLISNSIGVGLLGVVGFLLLIFAQGGVNWITVVEGLALLLITIYLVARRISDRYTNYVITNHRLIRVSGIFGRKLASIPWNRMTGLGYFQRPMGRILGYATIFIESANEESGLREFSDINDPATFHQKILDMMSAKSGQSSKDPPAPTRGERKKYLQRRRERRAASLRQAIRSAQLAHRSRLASAVREGESAVKSDTAEVYEALSPQEGGESPAPRSRASPRPPIAEPAPDTRSRPQPEPRPRRHQVPPPQQRMPEPERDPVAEREEARAAEPEPEEPQRNWLWPGGSRPGRVDEGPPVEEQEPVAMPEPEPAEWTEQPEPEPEPEEQEWEPQQSKRWPWQRRKSMESAPPSQEPGTSARDALAALRNSRRQPSPMRKRARLPSFGRTSRTAEPTPPRPNRPTRKKTKHPEVPPESRQLPRGDDD